MAFVLFFTGCAVWLSIRSRLTMAVALAATTAFIVTVLRDGALPPVPFVEDVIADAVIHGGALGRALLLAGIAAVAAPALLAGRVAAAQQRALIIFLGAWLVLLIASVVGPYPTPLLGYGASAVIGYFVAVVALRPSPGAHPRTVH